MYVEQLGYYEGLACKSSGPLLLSVPCVLLCTLKCVASEMIEGKSHFIAWVKLGVTIPNTRIGAVQEKVLACGRDKVGCWEDQCRESVCFCKSLGEGCCFLWIWAAATSVSHMAQCLWLTEASTSALLGTPVAEASSESITVLPKVRGSWQR